MHNLDLILNCFIRAEQIKSRKRQTSTHSGDKRRGSKGVSFIILLFVCTPLSFDSFMSLREQSWSQTRMQKCGIKKDICKEIELNCLGLGICV